MTGYSLLLLLIFLIISVFVYSKITEAVFTVKPEFFTQSNMK